MADDPSAATLDRSNDAPNRAIADPTRRKSLTDVPEYDLVEGDATAIAARILPLCRTVLPDFVDGHLLDRLGMVRAPLLLLSSIGGRDVGFKLGYLRQPRLFYSWLGGVMPDARRSGIAAGLMTAQHLHLASCGHDFIETRCRTSNNPMVILNLRHGFHVVGFEVDPEKGPVVLMRKDLVASRHRE